MKKLKELFHPDIANSSLVIINNETGAERPFTIDDHYKEISWIELSGRVPEEIRNQFEVAKDLYVYAWFVYEFYAVAHSKLLNVLEYGLKASINEENLNKYCKENNRRTRGLSTLLLYIRDNGVVKRQNFERFNESSLSDDKVLDLVFGSMVDFRNKYSHGSTTITNQIVYFFDAVKIILEVSFSD